MLLKLLVDIEVSTKPPQESIHIGFLPQTYQGL